ncbi:MAG: hypothetical protein HN361_02325 [Actinobacteria bacterium]|jgi:hypothetical protein|nr:hypothetical protein [Actinomycetota bacterium]MBT3970275.1 hypothetical protein [Actinomycetota bacterium]MBT4009168.1 hypothetical protein [Actinomycetota bacterium]MBT4303808.1 hypothetical protein [Actinomycetota bacterium]MBT5084831.1 hypothetical protein [Actinomycetota bacterium]
MVKLAMNRISGKHWSSIFLFFSIAFLAAASIVHFSSPAEATTGYWNGNSPRNYYRVYLSPAWHSSTAGARGECLNKSERSMARVTAYHASVYDWVSGMFTLRERGYDVAVGIGSPVANKNDSNSWGANYHIPIHSNAAWGCSSPISSSNAGTRVIYVSSGGSGLASKLVYYVGQRNYTSYGSPSPGTNDYRGHVNTGITSFDCISGNGVPALTEVCYTTAVAAYLEAEFHDWNTGASWLDTTNWQSRIGWSVDVYLGYP